MPAVHALGRSHDQRPIVRRALTLAPVLGLALLGGSAATLSILPASREAAPSARPQARDDQPILDAIDDLYASISGGVDEARDLDRLRAVCTENVRLTVAPAPSNPTGKPVVMTLDQYIERAGPVLVRCGFREKGLHNTVEQFGAVAHVFSSYAATVAVDPRTGEVHQADKPYARGINSIQLIKIDGSWRVDSILWDEERLPDQPIPPKYLPAQAPAPR